MALTEGYIAEKLASYYKPHAAVLTDGYAGPSTDADTRCAAVLMPLVRQENIWHLLFTHRTEKVEHHKGQVSFPGGACEASEETPEATALREAREEIGLDPGRVRVLGRLNDLVTITRYRITPVVGVIPYPINFTLETDEVERVFLIPLEWLGRSENWDEQPRSVSGQLHLPPVIIYHSYDGEVVWGATARMTHHFLSAVGLLKK